MKRVLWVFLVLCACAGQMQRAGATCVVVVAQGNSAVVAGDTWANVWDAHAKRYAARGQVTKVLRLGDMVLGVTGASAELARGPDGKLRLAWDALDDGRKAFGTETSGLTDDQVSAGVERWAQTVEARLNSTRSLPGAEGGAPVTLLVFRFTPQGAFHIVMDNVERLNGAWKGKISREGGAADEKSHYLAVGTCGEYFVSPWRQNGPLNATEYQEMLKLRSAVEGVHGPAQVQRAALALELFATHVNERGADAGHRSIGPPFDVLTWDPEKKAWAGARVQVKTGPPPEGAAQKP